MWKVTNKFNDIRKFRDGKLGRDVLVNPGETKFTMTPPIANEVFEVKKIDDLKVDKDKNNIKKEMKKDDSSSSR